MNTLLLLALAIAPGIFLVYRHSARDIYKKEPWIIVWKSFLWGAATVIPAGMLESSIEIPQPDSLRGMLLENFLVIALTEELCKLAVIRFYAYRTPHFDETMDGIVYGVAVASGFATFENIYYVMEHGMAVGMLRALLSVPTHISQGAVLGYWLAKARFQRVASWQAYGISLGIVVTTHGFFDFVLGFPDAEYFYLSPLPLILLGWLVKRYVKQALAHDAEHIHGLTVTSITAPAATAPAGSLAPSIRNLVYIALRFLSIICYLTAGFLMLGWVSNYLEQGEELWALILPLTPLLLGLYMAAKARKLLVQQG
ncbi:MAG: PrsW family intramembrane metalloprotease [Methylococcaceae bacterium]|nr:MAG: PrsW family intramembrane metalloprotease [Methylococcaceae bacterium]